MDEAGKSLATKSVKSRSLFRPKNVLAALICLGATFWTVETYRVWKRPVRGWVNQLRWGSLDNRQIAARQLADAVAEDYDLSVPSLKAALANDADVSVRVAAASALGSLGIASLTADSQKGEPKEVVEALTQALRDSDLEVRNTAAYALGNLAVSARSKDYPGERSAVVSALVELLKDPESGVRSEAEQAMKRVIGKAELEPPAALVEGLARWDRKESRAQAASLLGSFRAGVPATVVVLTTALKDPEPEVRTNAAVSLGRIGRDASPALTALATNLGDPFVPPPPPPVPQFSVVQTPLSGTTSTPAEKIRCDPAVEAARALGRILEAQAGTSPPTPTEVVEALTRATQSPRPEVKEQAEKALSKTSKGA